MIKKISKKKNLVKINFLILFLTSLYVTAQDYDVMPLSDFLEVYKSKYIDISEQIENNNKITATEKLVLYENKITKLKEEFKNSRKSEYLAKSIKRAKRVTCKGERIRGVTNCQSVFVNAPSEYMYTKKDWVTVEGESKNMKVLIDSSSVRLSMSSTGTRINKGAIYATFKYKPQLISSIIDKESDELFDKIIEKK